MDKRTKSLIASFSLGAYFFGMAFQKLLTDGFAISVAESALFGAYLIALGLATKKSTRWIVCGIALAVLSLIVLWERYW